MSMPAPQYPYPAPPQPPKRALPLVAFILACCLIIPFVPLIGGILGIVAVATGKPNEPRRGLGIAAIPVGFGGGLLLQGILAAVAIPAFMGYAKKSKSIEASMELRKLSSSVKMMGAERGEMPKGETEWTPPSACCTQPRGRCLPEPSLWSSPPWSDLQFSMDDPHYFQYRYTSDGQTAKLEARGDLDCDGSYSHYQIDLHMESGFPESGPMLRENESE